MNRRIVHLDENDKTTSLQEEPFETEALLQQLLAKHPDLLAGELIDRDDPRDWILIKKEMGIPGEENGGDKWLLDHLYVDQDGIPTLVEVKKGGQHGHSPKGRRADARLRGKRSGLLAH